MAHYATCFNCAVDKVSCPRRLALQKALVGSNVTSIKFKCLDRKAHFSTGQRVSFDWTMWESDGYDESSLPLVFHGTVIRERGSKFVVQVDAGKDASGEGIEASDVFKKNEALLIKVRPANMKALDEPSQTVCLTCYQIAGSAESRCYRSGSRCYRSGTDWVPNGCIGGAA
ncbi:hypothetical protein J2855_001789 [Agrobacterium tumefaciens]|uniref:hypothetical protein n=1 Tax=Agrobacterium tumefaciens TaxID=358 RepID=UPI0013AF0E81|nr:hypothetical protein [Agrobacterium tumefaciens]MBP2508154.1 hypothetical protein [Agrobacterium tumefaciens]MBP2517306.1 hypothetical protein [Agrobacterium tumefaciens]MBP2575940.1 hypothetical protein [Agrobacterium tumefaciens]MBP2594296.1 hypothetical protein [Agrobacterium tumefaciens]